MPDAVHSSVGFRWLVFYKLKLIKLQLMRRSQEFWTVRFPEIGWNILWPSRSLSVPYALRSLTIPAPVPRRRANLSWKSDKNNASLLYTVQSVKFSSISEAHHGFTQRFRDFFSKKKMSGGRKRHPQTSITLLQRENFGLSSYSGTRMSRGTNSPWNEPIYKFIRKILILGGTSKQIHMGTARHHQST
jgi:hypothetical protein